MAMAVPSFPFQQGQHGPRASGTPLPVPPAEWAELWQSLAGAAGLAPDEPLLVALSGGADSVLLACLAASARPRPPLVCVHVDHGLRGAESQADADYCARLCAALDVPLGVRAVLLDPKPSGLEARAREARYQVLVAEARRSGHRTILTGHHADDGLETLLMRWIRGTRGDGLAALRARRSFRDAPDVSVVRPLLPLRREDVRALLASAGIGWREDKSNADVVFRRNRVRHQLLPQIEKIGGERAVENLFAFLGAVEHLEQELQRATAHIVWSEPAHGGRSALEPAGARAGVLRRGELMRLAPALRRHALTRLLAERTGHAPGRVLLELLLRDLETGRCGRRSLPGRWSLWLRSEVLHLSPPLAMPERLAQAATDTSRQLELPFPPAAERGELRLAVPGTLVLPDDRRLFAEHLRVASRDVPRGSAEVELDLASLPGVLEQGLCVRWPRPGDRFRGLGAPGSKALSRFLSESGIPVEERRRVPLVLCGEEIVWVGGVRPAERCRVHAGTRDRVRLSLLAQEPAAR